MTTVMNARANNLGLVQLGENAVAKFLADGRVEVTQGEVGSYRYRRLFDRKTLEDGYAAWESSMPRDEDGTVKLSADTWAVYYETHIDFGGGELEMVDGFGSSVGLDVKDVQQLISVMTH